MRIFLLPMGQERYTCYLAATPEPESDRNAPASAPSGRLQRLKAKWADGYRRLEKKRPMAERIGARLRKLESVEIVYPEGLSETDAHEIFSNFLMHQVKHERSWKRRDAVLACLGAPLFFLPGPNIWFYYPAIRALGHYYAESGCKKFLAAGGHAQPARPMHYTPSSPLAEIKHMVDAPKRRRLDKSRIAQIGHDLGLPELVDLYKKRMAWLRIGRAS